MLLLSFEQYLAKSEAELPDYLRDREHMTHCDCCGRKSSRLMGDGRCRACMKYSWGYDQAEEIAVEALLGGAVKAALGAYIDPSLIRRAVDEAIDAYNDESANEYIRGLKAAN